MHTYCFSDALNYNHARLSAMHNASFQGYFVPLEMTAAMSANFWRVNQIDATRCVVMHDAHDEFVGMARVGARGQRGWCGGFGIVPAFRGTGASVLLAQQMIHVARESGLTTLQLEVLTQNVRAIRLYEKVGFVHIRRLLGLEIATATLSHDTSLQVERVPVETLLLPLLQDGQRRCWGCEMASLLTMQLEGFVILADAGTINGILVQRANGKMRVVATMLQKNLADLALATLLRSAAGDAQDIQAYNEAEESLFREYCARLGFREFFSQYEMSVQL